MQINNSSREGMTACAPKILNVGKAAEYLSVSESFLNKARISGTGPAYAKLGSRVVYRPEALDEWVISRERMNTSQEAA